MNNWELGESESARRRIEIDNGAGEVAREKRCGIGLSIPDGMEAAREGVKFVGGSYLMAFEFSQAAFNSNACGGHEI